VSADSISSLIAAAERGDNLSHEALFTALYAELHRLAGRELARRGAPPSLGVTTLLHEAYLDIAGRGGASFPDRGRFMGYAARVMRGLILNHVRARRAQKRGDRFEITSVESEVMEPPEERELTSISDALDELAKVDPALAQLVDLKFFCGFSFADIAAMRGVSERTIQRDWQKARLLLHRGLSPD
jgi:RNA polymerase sigma factor (TIGR02999 family)